MESSELPPLRTILHKEVPSSVVDQLTFLWRAATACLDQDPVTVSSSSHRLSQTFMQTARQHKVEIPAQVSDKLCGFCSVLLVPSVTCHVRVRPRSRQSRVNRSNPERLKNELVVRCELCQRSSKAPGFLQKKKDAVSKAVPINSALAPVAGLAAPIVSNTQPAKKGFSFLKRPHAPEPTARRLSAPGKLDSADFVSFASSSSVSTTSKLSQANSSSLQALSAGLFAGKRSNEVSQQGSLNLLELEALNKKKRRKTLGTTGP